jgi:hypothetical protein
MAVKVYSRFELAKNQLVAAFGLFATGRDRYSVITLAGAADVIFSQLLIRKGIDNFSDHMAELERSEGVSGASRTSTGKSMNDLLFINHMKHLDPDDSVEIEIEIEECALGALAKAMVNYRTLTSEKDPIFLAFVLWSIRNLDREKYHGVTELQHIFPKETYKGNNSDTP